MAKRKQYTDEQKKKIIAAIENRKAGETIDEAMKRLGVYRSMVDKWRAKFKLPNGERGSVPLEVIPDRPGKRYYKKKGTGNVRVDVAQKLIALANQFLNEAAED